MIKSGDPIEQEKQLKYASLVANTIMLSNVADMTDGLVIWPRTDTPSRPTSSPVPAPTPAGTFRALANMLSTWVICQNPSIPSRFHSKSPCDNFLHVSSTYPMREAEQRGLAYLFKLRLTANVKRMIERLSTQREWANTGQGWQAKESLLRLEGWSRQRRVIILRRRVKGDLAISSNETSGQQTLSFVDVGAGVDVYDIPFSPHRSTRSL